MWCLVYALLMGGAPRQPLVTNLKLNWLFTYLEFCVQITCSDDKMALTRHKVFPSTLTFLHQLSTRLYPKSKRPEGGHPTEWPCNLRRPTRPPHAHRYRLRGEESPRFRVSHALATPNWPHKRCNENRKPTMIRNNTESEGRSLWCRSHTVSICPSGFSVYGERGRWIPLIGVSHPPVTPKTVPRAIESERRALWLRVHAISICPIGLSMDGEIGRWIP
jgi:hypothetical protein